MEHVERQEERESEIKASADELDQQADQLEERGDELQQQIDDTRAEFEQKQRAEDVPGAQEPLGPEGSDPPPEADEPAGDE